MTTRDLLRLVLSNLRRMKARVAMTAIGVIIGTAAVVVLVSLGAGLQRRATESLYSFGSLTELQVFQTGYYGPIDAGLSGQSQDSQQPVLNNDALDRIRQIPNVVAVTPLEWLNAGELRLGRQTGYGSILGVDEAAFALIDPDVMSGTLDLQRGQVVIGAYVPQNFLDWEAMQRGDQPPELMDQTLRLVIYPYSTDPMQMPQPSFARIRVVGVLRPQGYQYDYNIFMTLKEVLDINAQVIGQRPNKDKEGYMQVLVKVDEPNRSVVVEQAIREMGFEVQSARSMLEQINSLFRIIQAVLGGIGAVALLVAAFGIANTMMMAIYERTREIGLMKALGASNQGVMSVFLAEAGGIGLIGGIGGVLLGLGLGGIVNLVGNSLLGSQTGAPISYGPPAPEASALTYTPLWLPIFAVAFATLIGIASGVYPALRAAALSPIVALKYE